MICDTKRDDGEMSWGMAIGVVLGQLLRGIVYVLYLILGAPVLLFKIARFILRRGKTEGGK